ncbi:MAG: chromosomal replication initiator protein DnaA [Thermodesulfovibrionales bacterium]|nr:chromosomal replication initiator protein DnaA [Thermodesulfovibrionales bacterium]
MSIVDIKIEEIIEKAFNSIKAIVGEGVFELWFKPIKLVNVKDGLLIFEIPNRFYKEWLEDNYPDLIENTIFEVSKFRYSTKFKIHEKVDSEIKKNEAKKEIRKQKLISKGIFLNPKYTFSNFVVGASNDFAHAAAKKVTENPGKTYNPLFIYGSSGLGKTHLINAIGNEIFDRNPSLNIYYKSIDVLTNEIITSLRQGKTGELLESLRPVDVFLVDDIHLIAGKEGTQVQFFHIFNALYENQRQIILTSDRPPVEIADISDRLRSRFNMGLIADIQPPDIETKMAIFQKKAENEGLVIPYDVAYFICSRVKSNIRDLEGCLIKLGAHASLTGKKIDINLTKEVLKELVVDDEKPINADTVLKIVSDYLNLKVSDIKSKKRTKEISNARQLAMYLCKKTTNMSLSEIGSNFGGKDHATVIYACKQIDEKTKQDDNFNKMVDVLIKRIKNQ